AIGWGVLVTIWDPDSRDASLAKGAANRRADLATDNSMFDPELTNASVPMGQGESVSGFKVREKCGIEIHPQAVVLRPINPAAKMLGSKLVAVHALAIRFGVECVEIQPMPARDK